ncbi:MAG: HD domain-containing protein, partial [Candidatus Firestonebacteria bacterium]
QAFNDDALRMIRAVRIAGELNFTISKKTETLIKKQCSLIADISQERIRDELFRILILENSNLYIQKLDKLKLLDKVIPGIKSMKGVEQPGYHHLDVWGHSLETVDFLDNILKEIEKIDSMWLIKIEKHLSVEPVKGRTRYTLLKFAGLLHDIGKPETKTYKDGKTKFVGHEKLGAEKIKVIAKNLKLSLKEQKILSKIVHEHLRIGFLSDSKYITKRAIYKFFRDTKDEAIDVCLLALADRLATRGEKSDLSSMHRHFEIIAQLIDSYYSEKEIVKPAKIISGNDIMKKFKLISGPLIGKLLETVTQAQAEGKVKTKTEALQYLKHFVK